MFGFRFSVHTAMKRRDKTGGKAAKTQRPGTLKRRNAPKTARRRSSLESEQTVARITRERDEAREQQTATAEILRVIRTSPTDTQPVFEAIVQSGLKLFPDAAILIALPDGNKLRAAAFAEPDPARAKVLLSRWAIPLTREYMHAIAILDRRTIDISDAREASPELATGAQYFLTTGYQAITIMPMMRGGDAIGALSVVRLAPGALSDKQIAVLKTFADQAVIAIENTRLLNELRESLQQQTATSEVLSTIASSAGELQPVFETMLAKATALCEASYGTMWLREGDAFRAGAIHGALPEAFLQLHRTRNLYRAGPGAPAYEAIINRQTCAVADLRETRGYREGSELPVAAADIGGIRTMVAVPMFKEDEPIASSPFIDGKCGHSTINRSSLSAILPSKPSSPSRTRGCSTSCVNHCSSRPPPPTCSRSSAARPSICRPC